VCRRGCSNHITNEYALIVFGGYTTSAGFVGGEAKGSTFWLIQAANNGRKAEINDAANKVGQYTFGASAAARDMRKMKVNFAQKKVEIKAKIDYNSMPIISVLFNAVRRMALHLMSLTGPTLLSSSRIKALWVKEEEGVYRCAAKMQITINNRGLIFKEKILCIKRLWF
jgi:hypothetical protein